MTGLQTALHGLWDGIAYDGKTVSAYVEGHLPDSVQFPYIVYQVGDTELAGSILLNAWLWVKDDDGNGNRIRAGILDGISKRIHSGCTHLRYDGGFCSVFRGAPWQQIYNDPNDPAVIGCRMQIELHNYKY